MRSPANGGRSGCYDRAIQNGILLDEFFRFVKNHNPELLEIIRAIQTRSAAKLRIAASSTPATLATTAMGTNGRKVARAVAID
jgi:hypothetical protein